MSATVKNATVTISLRFFQRLLLTNKNLSVKTSAAPRASAGVLSNKSEYIKLCYRKWESERYWKRERERPRSHTSASQMEWKSGNNVYACSVEIVSENDGPNARVRLVDAKTHMTPSRESNALARDDATSIRNGEIPTDCTVIDWPITTEWMSMK